MANKKGYSKPKLHDCGGLLTNAEGKSTEWFIDFRMTCPTTGRRKPFSYRFGINWLQTKAERYEEAKTIIKLLHEALKSGWNPFEQNIDDYLQNGLPLPDDVPAALTFIAGMDKAIATKKGHLKDKSYRTYLSAVEIAKKSAMIIKIADKPVDIIEKCHIKALLEQMAKDRQAEYDREGDGKKFTGNNYNKYREILRAMFSELEDFGDVKYNPCKKITLRPEINTNLHRHATVQEREFIREHLPKDDPRLFILLMYEFHTGMRPREILSLKVKDFDWFNQAFDLAATEEGAKTRTARKVPIPNVLMKYIRSQGLDKYNADDYIFSTYLLPGPVHQKVDTITERWKKVIKRGYGINVTLYSFKGLGGENKREAGVSLKAVSKGSFGHTKQAQSFTYLPYEHDRINHEIMQITPDF